MGRKVGADEPLLKGAGFRSNTMSTGPKSTSVPSGILIHPAVWPQQTWAENWGVVPLFRGVALAGSSSNTVWPRVEDYLRAKVYLDPSNRLTTNTNVTDRQDRQDRETDNGPTA